jgi:hypothetical protein
MCALNVFLSNEARDAAAGGHFFLHSTAKNSQPVLTPVRKAEATARLFTNALNPLAHPEGPGCCH